MLYGDSEEKLKGVHDDLARIVRIASLYEGPDILVTEGLRTYEHQKELRLAKLSDTMNSRHLTGHAVDLCVIVGGRARWDWPAFRPLAARMKAAAASLGLEVEWGGNWRRFPDGPHFQLPWTKYPAPITEDLPRRV